MEHLYHLKEKLHKELKEFDGKKDLSVGDLTTIHTLTDTIKNIDKICMLEEEGGYSEAVDHDMRMPPNMRGGASYRGGRSRTGGYDDGYSQKRNRMGRYSRDDGEKMRIVKEVENMRNLFTDDEWDMIEDIVHRIKGAA